MRKSGILLLLSVVSGIGFAGCAKHSQPQAIKSPLKSQAIERLNSVDLKKIRPNELGKVLILEYHDVGPREERWVRRSDHFKSDLLRLYKLGYYPISLRDYVSNHIDTPPGKSPVVITFDDATKGQFNYLNDGTSEKVDPNCAVAIMEDIHKTHPDWPLKATFYVYYPLPFRQKDSIGRKMQHILDLGMDIGNHTYTHTRLDKESDAGAAREMAMNVKSTLQYAPKATADSIALPYGKGPKNHTVLASGNYDGTSYHNIAALLVGAEPAPSPVSKEFDPYKLPRVQAIDEELDKWLGYFQRHPEKRYVSDGDPNTVTVPRDIADEIDKSRLNKTKLRIY